MFRGTVGTMVVALMVVATGVAVAQDGANIVVAEEIVARVREAGSYQSIQARADAIHQAINTAMVGQNPATVEVSLRQVNDQWTVFVAGQSVMSVLPAEAEANGMAPHVLASIWVEKLKKALANFRPATSTTSVASTVTDLGNPLETEPTTSAPPSTTTATTPTTSSTTEVLEIPVADITPVTTPATPTAPTTTTTTATTSVASAQGARLLIIDAFNKVRGMSEDEYVRARQARAGELLDDLVSVMSGGAQSLPEEPMVGETDTGVSTVSVTPTTPGVEEIPLGPTGTTTTVGTAGTATPPVTTGGGSTITGSATSQAELREGIPQDDPSYSRVPQKRRIGKKFEAAAQPYLRLKASDPASAVQISELLKLARRENAAGNFDLAEEYLDGALRMLGVTQW